MAPFFKSTKIFLEFKKIVAVFDDLFIFYGLFIVCYLFSVHNVKGLRKLHWCMFWLTANIEQR